MIYKQQEARENCVMEIQKPGVFKENYVFIIVYVIAVILWSLFQLTGVIIGHKLVINGNDHVHWYGF